MECFDRSRPLNGFQGPYINWSSWSRLSIKIYWEKYFPLIHVSQQLRFRFMKKYQGSTDAKDIHTSQYFFPKNVARNETAEKLRRACSSQLLAPRLRLLFHLLWAGESAIQTIWTIFSWRDNALMMASLYIPSTSSAKHNKTNLVPRNSYVPETSGMSCAPNWEVFYSGI